MGMGTRAEPSGEEAAPPKEVFEDSKEAVHRRRWALNPMADHVGEDPWRHIRPYEHDVGGVSGAAATMMEIGERRQQ